MSEMFCLHDDVWARISLRDLMARQDRDGDLVARAEVMGEGCHVEVAIWNYALDTWQRYASKKCLGGEHPDMPDAGGVATAERFVAQINGNRGMYAPLIHLLPMYTPAPEPVS